MEDYLIDRETLGQFIDELMKKRPLPVNSAEEISNYREAQMHALDDRISQAIIGSLNQEQAETLDSLLDQEKENPDVFRDFFSNQGINVEQIITNTAESFGKEYLEGATNAQ